MLGALYIIFPDDFQKELMTSFLLITGVFVLFPVIFFLARKICRTYLNRQYKKADDLIKQFEKEKKEILETVMEKEPYNKAKEILKKYDPSFLRGQEEEIRKSTDSNVRRRNIGPSTETSQLEAVRRGPIRPQSATKAPHNLNATLPAQQISTPVQQQQFSSPQYRKKPQTIRPLPGSGNANQTKMDKIVSWYFTTSSFIYNLL